ncbi:DUF2326 domain-containing protein [Polaromonas sp. P1(28)-8]|nr:DUF2326 domain-containing protein [Polaromonas sp. P1(28)-8]
MTIVRGRFVVHATDNGPEFGISIEGDRGGGISNIEIFCFDLALFKVVTKRLGGPTFLLHDSHLFDGVDERQIAGALLLGMEATQGKGLQYIVTMNSDIFERLPLPKTIDPGEVVLDTRLSDQGEAGGLLAFVLGDRSVPGEGNQMDESQDDQDHQDEIRYLSFNEIDFKKTFEGFCSLSLLLR